MHPSARAFLLCTVFLPFAEGALAQLTLTSSALDELERTNAESFRRVNEIVRVASEEGCASAARIAVSQFGVKNARCDPPSVLRTSDPPKTRLTFSMEGTSYIYFVTTGKPPKRLPADEGLQRKTPAQPARDGESN